MRLFQRVPSLCSRRRVSETVSTKGKQHRFLCSHSLLCRGRGESGRWLTSIIPYTRPRGRIADVKSAWATQQFLSWLGQLDKILPQNRTPFFSFKYCPPIELALFSPHRIQPHYNFPSLYSSSLSPPPCHLDQPPLRLSLENKQVSNG